MATIIGEPSTSGPVRDGSFGRVVEGAVVAECGKCGVERLDEGACHDESLYVDEAYRKLLDEGVDAPSFLAEHDPLQLRNVMVLQPHRIRNRVVADIGAAQEAFSITCRVWPLPLLRLSPVLRITILCDRVRTRFSLSAMRSRLRVAETSTLQQVFPSLSTYVIHARSWRI